MVFDKTTEAIAYFIGLFQLVTETARGRLEYDSFKASQQAPELDPMLLPGSHRTVSFDPEGHDPAVNDPQSFIQKVTIPSAVPDMVGPQLGRVWQPPQPVQAAPGVVVQGGPGGGPQVQIVDIPPPGGTIQLSLQQNWLLDNDTLNLAPEISAAWVNAQSQAMKFLTVSVEALQILDAKDGTAFLEMSAADIEGLAQVLAAAFETPTKVTPEAMSHLSTGAATQQVTVNGSQVEEMPDWVESLPDVPQFAEWQDQASATPTSQGSAQPGTTQQGRDVTGVPGYDPVEPVEEGGSDSDAEGGEDVGAPNTLITGGNEAINSLVTGTGGVDAPVIAVAGDVVSLDVISQINVLCDDSASVTQNNLLQNSAEFAGLPTLASEEEDEEDAAASSTSAGSGAPLEVLAISTIEGDLVNFSWTRQINAVVDNDAVQITTSGAQSWIDLGSNTLLNIDSLFGQAMGFDLILVGGNMISQYIVEQVNVLLDWDSFLDSTPDSLDTDLFLTEDVGDAGAETGGNVLINAASITHTALDQFDTLAAEFQSVFDSFGAGVPDVSPLIASGALQSHPVLKVLYISGDLIDVHLLSQVNSVSDSDLVVGAEIAAAATEIHSGLNALINNAQLIDIGMASDVFAGGEIYSDAVLHQANLITNDAPPSDVFLAPGTIDGLASEAVAFLSDDMNVSTNGAESLATGDSSVAQDGPIHIDVMQTMLA